MSRFARFIPNFSRWTPKSGPLKSATDYLALVASDYKAVLSEAASDARSRPLRSYVIGGVLATGFAAYKLNPKWSDFTDQLSTASQNLGLIGDSVKNPSSLEHIQHLNELAQERILRYFSFGIGSVIWQDVADPTAALYESKCKYMRPTLVEIGRDRLVDVGLFGKWRNLERKMIDFDVNPAEWESPKEEAIHGK